jgi:hypothetical protein
MKLVRERRILGFNVTNARAGSIGAVWAKEAIMKLCKSGTLSMSGMDYRHH